MLVMLVILLNVIWEMGDVRESEKRATRGGGCTRSDWEGGGLGGVEHQQATPQVS
jgi:hypothetical protein